ncbi:TetR/AcrR family transcriptional regulator [Ekhidna sp.]|uniref:TetR/AcrR family transcriptional regulator n=1 Tax=Ekhidna sp. TaxID=2608089 RepID=UPI0032988AC2
MSQTKDRIIKAAINLFNDQGFVNVRLQNIADNLKISVGNLAYHFKNKEAIVSTAYDKIGEELSAILSTYRASPDLRDLDHQLGLYYKFIEKYPFYFTDTLEVKRNHPHLHEERKDFIRKMKIQFEKRLEYNKSRRIINEGITSGQLSQVASNMCTIVIFWYSGQAIQNETGKAANFKNSIWIQLFPFLTKRGLEEYHMLIASNDMIE